MRVEITLPCGECHGEGYLGNAVFDETPCKNCEQQGYRMFVQDYACRDGVFAEHKEEAVLEDAKDEYPAALTLKIL